MCLIVLDWNNETKQLILASNRDEYYNRPSQIAHYWSKKKKTTKNSTKKEPQQEENEHHNDNDDDDDDDNKEGNTTTTNGDDVLVYGGRDIQLGGTWLACSSSSSSSNDSNSNNNSNNRFAAVTNFHSKMSRLGQNQPGKSLSRGDLVYNFVSASDDAINDAKEYCQQLASTSNQYGGFCLLIFDGNHLYYCTNRRSRSSNINKTNTTDTTNTSSTTTTTTTTIENKEGDDADDDDEGRYEYSYYELMTGTYGISNHLIDTPWPKLINAKNGLQFGIEKYIIMDNDGSNPKSSSSSSKQHYQQHQQLAKYLIENVMENSNRVEDKSLLPTTLTYDEEYIRSSIFVIGTLFGTRTTTIVTYFPNNDNDNDNAVGGSFHVTEKNHITPNNPKKSSISYEHVSCRVRLGE